MVGLWAPLEAEVIIVSFMTRQVLQVKPLLPAFGGIQALGLPFHVAQWGTSFCSISVHPSWASNLRGLEMRQVSFKKRPNTFLIDWLDYKKEKEYLYLFLVLLLCWWFLSMCFVGLLDNPSLIMKSSCFWVWEEFCLMKLKFRTVLKKIITLFQEAQ